MFNESQQQNSLEGIENEGEGSLEPADGLGSLGSQQQNSLEGIET